MSNIAGETIFKITNTKIYALIVTLSTKDYEKLTKQLIDGFKDLFIGMSIKNNNKIKSRNLDQKNPTRFCLDASFQGVKRSFVLAFNNTVVDIANNPINNTNNRVDRKSYRKYFLPRVYITN